jgi:hypothetical protein
VGEAEKRGLIFKRAPFADPDSIKWIDSSQDKDGRLYDSRAGLGSYYRYGPRKVADLCNDPFVGVSVPLPKIHESVFERIDSGCNAYAPIGLPPDYQVVSRNGKLTPVGPGTYETPQGAVARFVAQEKLWNYVWMRRIAYFATLAATLHLAAFWLFHGLDKIHEFDSNIRMVSEAVRRVEDFLPRALHWWTDWYAANPEWFAGGIVAIAVFIGIGNSLSARIRDGMRIIWQSRPAPVPLSGALQDAIQAFRTHPIYQFILNLGRRHVVPFVLAFLMVWYCATLLSHLLFNAVDSTGLFCTRSETTTRVDQEIAGKTIDTSSICAPTGLFLREGFRYEITVTMIEPWESEGRPTTPVGYRTSTIQPSKRWRSYATIFLRRVLFRPWYRLIARVGDKGVDENFLDPVPVANTSPQAYRDTIKTERSGELFLYVNDAVIGLPWLYDWFYGPSHHHGKEKATVRML